MNVGLTIAGSLCFVLALGHTIGARLLLPDLPGSLPPNRFGDGEFMREAIVYTFYARGVMLAAPGAVLIALAQDDHIDDRGDVVFLIGAGLRRRAPRARVDEPPAIQRTAPIAAVLADARHQRPVLDQRVGRADSTLDRPNPSGDQLDHAGSGESPNAPIEPISGWLAP